MGTQRLDASFWVLTVKKRVVRVGLTGGIGSGKSTVAAMLQALGAEVIDADAISRTLTASGGAAIPSIAAVFGVDVIDSHGAMDRVKIREIVFNDASAKSRLENVLHPLIRQEMLFRANSPSLHSASCIVFDIPLFVESGAWNKFVDLVLVVDCTAQIQLARVQARSELPLPLIEKIVSTQASREVRLQVADIVLFNDTCSLEQLAEYVQKISTKLGL